MVITAIVGVAGTIVGALVAGLFAHFREKGNRDHALELKKLEIQDQREEKRFDARQDAYADLIKVTSVINTERYVIDDLSQALARVQMVSNSRMTTDIANGLVAVAQQARKRTNEVRKQGNKVEEDPEARTLISESRKAHAAFVSAVRNELFGVPIDKPYGRWRTDSEGEIPLAE